MKEDVIASLEDMLHRHREKQNNIRGKIQVLEEQIEEQKEILKALAEEQQEIDLHIIKVKKGNAS